MTEQEIKKLFNLADTIQEEINQMIVTQDLVELETMALRAAKNIEKLKEIKWQDFKSIEDIKKQVKKLSEISFVNEYEHGFHMAMICVQNMLDGVDDSAEKTGDSHEER